MSLDILGTLELLAASGDVGQTVSDLATLYKVVSAGKPDIAAMDKAGTLEPTVAALARISGKVDGMLKNQAERPHIVALLASF